MPGSREEDFKTKMHSNNMTLIDLNALAQEPLPLLVIKRFVQTLPWWLLQYPQFGWSMSEGRKADF